MRTIFKNKLRLSYKDIILQISFVIFILFLIYILSPLRNNRQELPLLIFSPLAVIIMLWIIIKTIREQTVIQININDVSKTLTLIIQRQFRGYALIEFQPNFIYEIRNIPSKSLPPIREIVISDNQKSITLSTRNVGFDESNFDIVVEELKNALPLTAATR